MLRSRDTHDNVDDTKVAPRKVRTDCEGDCALNDCAVEVVLWLEAIMVMITIKFGVVTQNLQRWSSAMRTDIPIPDGEVGVLHHFD